MIYPAEICEVLPGQFFSKKIPEELQGKVVLDFAMMRLSKHLDLHTFQHIGSDNIGSAENDKCPILSAWLISAEISNNIGLAEKYLFTIISGWLRYIYLP